MFDQRILVIGNNDQDTDHRTTVLAHEYHTDNHGLITTAQFERSLPGFYHTTVLDIGSGGIVKISAMFDQVWLLDQPVEAWSNWKVLLSSFKVMLELERRGVTVVFRSNQNVQRLLFWHDIIRDKPGFCVYPWILLTNEHGYTTTCLRSNVRITDVDQIQSWQHDPEYAKVRGQFLSGDRVEYDRCRYCYQLEDAGIESPRMFESMEWAAKLDLDARESALAEIRSPQFYEIRLDNRCNLACRHCHPVFSSLIEDQWKRFEIQWEGKMTFSSFDLVRVEDITPTTRIHLTGGEVTVMPEFQDFLRRCIDLGLTDFDLSVGSNGFKIPQKVWDLCDHFPRMVWSISLDGHGRVNDYIRWPSDFDTVIANCHKLIQRGHTVSINHVPSIFNVTSLHLLFEFLDRELPDCNVYTQINYFSHQSVYNHPNHDMAVASLEKLTRTNAYHKDGRGTKTTFDAVLRHYQNRPQFNREDLRKFFEINDKIDLAQNRRLGDYIPELEACRSLVV